MRASGITDQGLAAPLVLVKGEEKAGFFKK